MLTIERLGVRASLDEGQVALERAEAEAKAGDRSWQQWVAEYDRGEAMIVRLDVFLVANNGERSTVELSNRGLFIESSDHPPKVERQIAELVSKDFSLLAGELSKLGHRIDEHELDEMYVHVELADDLREALARSGPPNGSADKAAPRAEVRLSEAEGPRLA